MLRRLASLHLMGVSACLRVWCLFNRIKAYLFNLNDYLVEIALPLRKTDAGAGLSKCKAKFAMKYNNDYFVLSLCPGVLNLYYFQNKSSITNVFAILLDKIYLLYLKLNSLICLQHKHGNHKNLYSCPLPQLTFEIVQNLTRFHVWTSRPNTAINVQSATGAQEEMKALLKVTCTNDNNIPLISRRVRTAEGTILALAWHDWVLTVPVISSSLLVPPSLLLFPFAATGTCTHKHAKSLIQLKILLGRKRSRDNAGQQELPAIRLA